MSVKKKRIYLDYAATTPVDKKVLAVMQSYFDYQFGNASEIHDWGREAKEAIEKARGQVARALGANEKEIIFTSCATESINLSHKGLIEAIRDARGETKPHIITTQIEHKAVLETCKHLEMAGLAEVTYLPVDNDGLVNLADLEKAIKPETVLVSVMYVNNEVGIIEPITEMGKLLQQINTSRIASHLPRIYFHTDATQAIQYLDCDVNKLGVDLLSLTGHKFYAPKGIGILYCRGGTPLAGQQHGGGQEFGRRAGTENVPYIAGLGQAIEEAANRRAEISTRLEKLRDRLIEKILQIPQVILTGHPQQRSPHIASFIVKGVEGEAILLMLNEQGVGASSGSACTSSSLAPSHVLVAMGFKPEDSHGSLRLSLGKETTEEEVDFTANILPGIIKRLRQIAPKLNTEDLEHLTHNHHHED